ncbi:uncharacterized protein CLUP02_00535 [Colletotrichum lupini]|uniref:RING-type E3 ubiquitin transferase n=1 Tax=Colletotrichum lupini TaxID=145971 RepID=A0A9Q8SB94_9PEZI|nr:uncharacterized protein CLUP02_00535 [Colletotrichum lupini]KAK1719557.1 hypothetical protein BDP67DRAFT_502138 [Colletotrichum lupini]UQC73888.1 hypothetical protein CLUP02_00535 [Colletotrichum lupini]
MSPTSIPDAAVTDASTTWVPEKQPGAVAAALCVAFALLVGLVLYLFGWKKIRKLRHAPPPPPPPSLHLTTAGNHRSRHDSPDASTLSSYSLPRLPGRARMAKLTRGKLESLAKVAEAKTCPVCLDDFVAGSVVGQLPCGHVFCSACIELWLLKHSYTCPLCRFNLEAGEVHAKPRERGVQ